MAYRNILTDNKVYYMKLKNSGMSRISACNCSGISESTGYRLDKHGIKNPSKRNWRTRKDPLAAVWEDELLPLLEQFPDLEPMTLFEHLIDNHSDNFDKSILRTLQRKVRRWKGLHGKGKEVMFLQKHEAGEMGISDFTTLKDITITIDGNPLKHLLYHYRLVYSKWSYIKVVFGGESFVALSSGLQSALEECGGCPREHRTDSLSAAYNNSSSKEEFTQSYKELCDHYCIKATRNNPGKSHENGAIESPHGHIKHRIKQALILRDSYNFLTVEEYQLFIDKIVSRHNKNNRLAFEKEKLKLNPLPQHRAQDFTVSYCKVTTCSTISLKRIVYSVPSRLIGLRVEVHVYDNRLEVFYEGERTHVISKINDGISSRPHVINYRDIIDSLSQKPQAFRNFIWKDDLFPNEDYKKIWDIANNIFDSRKSCKYYVHLLLQVSKISVYRESLFSSYVLSFYKKHNNLPSIDTCQKRFKLKKTEGIPSVKSVQHSLEEYSSLLSNNVRYCHG